MRAILILIPTIFLFSSCNKEIEMNNTNPFNENMENISFDIYLISDIECQWENNNPNNNLIVINNEDEFQAQSDCEDEDIHSGIDFSEKTLLIAKGITTSSPAEVTNIELFKVSDNNYNLKIIVKRGYALTPDSWNIAITTPNIPTDAEINLEIQHVDY